MADTQEESVVYLQDIESQVSIPSTQSQSDPSVASTTSSQTSTSSKAALAVGNKRQRTLMDMFSGSQPDTASTPMAKKLKLSVSEPALSVQGKTSSLRLNAIPFSLSQYQESLSTDERRLLALECAYMGKSWLKVLKDEIKKPYFIALKKFLWEEGVREPDQIPKSLKIYPSRKSAPEFR